MIYEKAINYCADRWPEVFTEEALEKINYKCTPKGMLTQLLYLAKVACDKCDRCDSQANRYGSKSVFADGDIGAKIFVVGEGPGQFEQRTLIPFTHYVEWISSRCGFCNKLDACYPRKTMLSGERLPMTECKQAYCEDSEVIKRSEDRTRVPATVSNILNKAIYPEFTRDCWNKVKAIRGKARVESDLYITNVVKCRSVAFGKDIQPHVPCRNACKVWMDIQLTLVQPKILILLGGVAGQYFLGKDFMISKSNGLFNEVKALSIAYEGLPRSVEYIGCGYHPSAIGRVEDDVTKKDMLAGLKGVFVKAREQLDKKVEVTV
jgi:uracil-DNA glycosylase family 4